jgi:hypothetical protein
MGEDVDVKEKRTTRVEQRTQADPGEKDKSGLPIRQAIVFKREKNFWQLATFLSLIGAIATILYFRAEEGKKPFVYVVDGAGTIHFGPLEVLNPTSSVYTTTALWAAQAFFQRSPVGFDLPELISAYYRTDAADKAKADLKAQMPAIAAESMHLKPEISSIQFIKESGKIAIMRVRGQIIRAGSLTEQEMRRPALPFVLNLAIVPNPRLGQKDTVPFVVSDFGSYVDYAYNNEQQPSNAQSSVTPSASPELTASASPTPEPSENPAVPANTPAASTSP